MSSVLLVDDDAAYRQSLRAFLDASYDIEVVAETGDGAAAVDLARTLRPDAVVIDLAMPGLGGLETAARIREAAPETVVVIVTGVGGSEDRERAAHTGVDAWIVKGDALPVENALRSLTRGRRA